MALAPMMAQPKVLSPITWRYAVNGTVPERGRACRCGHAATSLCIVARRRSRRHRRRDDVQQTFEVLVVVEVDDETTAAIAVAVQIDARAQCVSEAIFEVLTCAGRARAVSGDGSGSGSAPAAPEEFDELFGLAHVEAAVEDSLQRLRS